MDNLKDFIAKNGEFTINIALIENNLPILGFIYKSNIMSDLSNIITPGGATLKGKRKSRVERLSKKED